MPGRPASSTPCGRWTTRGWTPAGTSTSTTPAAASTPSQLRQHQAELEAHVFGNPHSNNPTSQAMTDRVEHARE
ncbi:MAG: hypothetical protein R2712_03290 [Vicinamibacterales bacterium]